jgi:hypothetical protein
MPHYNQCTVTQSIFYDNQLGNTNSCHILAGCWQSCQKNKNHSNMTKFIKEMMRGQQKMVNTTKLNDDKYLIQLPADK